MNLKPLDLIFFRGSEIVSKTITQIERSVLDIPLKEMVWSHVGMLVDSRVIRIPELVPGKLYVLESTWSYAYGGDGITPVDGHRFGIQIRPLDQILAYYTSNPRVFVGYARLLRRPARLPDITELYHSRYRHRRYDFHPISLGSSVFPSLRPLRKIKRHIHFTPLTKPSFYFCSELIADIVKQLGWEGTEKPNSRDVLPMDLVGWDRDDFPQFWERPKRFEKKSLRLVLI